MTHSLLDASLPAHAIHPSFGMSAHEFRSSDLKAPETVLSPRETALILTSFLTLLLSIAAFLTI